MVRAATVITVALAASACSAEATPEYVVRLDLDQVAAATAARDSYAAPGFESLGPDAPAGSAPAMAASAPTGTP
jgi:hypothetical protein